MNDQAKQKKRIYVVECDADCRVLVRASSAAEARDHVTKVRVASQDDLVQFLGDGDKVVDAGEATET